MDYLGLGPDDAYDDYEGYDDYDAGDTGAHQRPPRDAEPRGQAARHQRGWEGDASSEVRTVQPRPSFPSKDFEASPRRSSGGTGANGRGDDSGVHVRPAPPPQQPAQPTLRSVPGGSMEPHTVRPRRFDQAQEVADSFKDGQPVIMNLEGTERGVARRLIDFASGICYALDGTMEKVATGVYLLKPRSAQRYDEHQD
jgi:cell division inhibitor SepF